MHVVVIADFATPSGGAQAVAIQSATALGARGISVSYVHAVDEPADPRLATGSVAHQGLAQRDVWDQSAIKGAVSGIWNRTAASRLRRCLAGLPPGPKVLHLHQWTRSFSPAIFPVLLQAGHPLAVTLHDYFIACPNGVYYRFDKGEPCSLVPLSAACLLAPCDPRSMAHKAVRVLRSLATRAVIRGQPFDLVHVSDRGRDTIAPYLPAGLRQHRIGNPVDIERGVPADVRNSDRIAFVGRLTREKGADLVAAAGRAAGIRTLFIGEGPAEAEIRRLDPDAELLGWRSPGEVQQILRTRVRAVAAPSRWFETGPLTIYEALGRGLPVIASSRSGAAEKVSHGQTGYVVEPSVPALAEAFSALSDPDLAAGMGRAAFDRYWAAPLSLEAHADALLELYEGMLGAAPDRANLPPR